MSFAAKPRLLVLLHKIWTMIGVILLLLVMLELGLGLGFLANDLFSGAETTSDNVRSDGVDARSRADAYAEAAWVQDYFREFKTSYVTDWHSYVYWRRRPFASEFINVNEQGIRRTWQSPAVAGSVTSGEPTMVARPAAADGAAAPATRITLDAEAALRIFVFGGSTVWGTGARDDYTIPSCLARDLHARGIETAVFNFGESGYVNTQSLLALICELRDGNIPDVAIFYDGINDIFAAYQDGRAGLPQNEGNRRREFQSLSRRRKDEEGGLRHVLLDKLLNGTNLGRLARVTRGRLLGSPAGASGDSGAEGDVGSVAATTKCSRKNNSRCQDGLIV